MAWKASLSDPAGRLPSWQGANPCSPSQPWVGVECTEDRFAVVGLSVSGFGLAGPLPPTSDLTQLKVRTTTFSVVYYLLCN
jgi:hypothetical protein